MERHHQTSPVCFGLIGVGGFARHHLENIRALEDEGLASLAAVADPRIEDFKDLRAELAAAGVRCYQDYRAMLEEEIDLHAVTIAAPIPYHFAMARDCIERDLFVYLEKPPAPLIQQLEALIEADTKERVSVGFQWITSDAIRRMKRLVCEGRLGEVRDIRVAGCWPRFDSYYQRAPWAGRMELNGVPVFDGPATNALSHLVHNVMHLASTELDGFETPVEVRGELYRARPIESYDVACMRGRFSSGTEFGVAVAHAAATALPFQIQVRGTKGWARMTEDGARFESSEDEGAVLNNCTDPLRRPYLEFVDWVTGRSTRTGTHLRDARGYVLATNAMLVSSGGIHEISARNVNHYTRNEECGFSVAGLVDAVREGFQSGRLFSELNLPWAMAAQAIRTAEIKALHLSEYARNGSAVACGGA